MNDHSEHEHMEHQHHDEPEDSPAGHAEAASEAHAKQSGHDEGHGDHSAHGVDHTGHEQMFRHRFWVSPAADHPGAAVSARCIQTWLGFTHAGIPRQPLDRAGFAVVIFFYGGCPSCRWRCPNCATASRA